MTNLISLHPAQVEQLLRPINPSRVAALDGMSHLEAYDVRAHLIRLFGFGGWSGDVLSMECLYEQETSTRAGKPAFKVAYRCLYRLTIRVNGQDLCSYTESAVGESVMPDFKRGDAHDMAVKTAESQALKRCAVNLGDQFGLSLYRQGSTAALVMRTLVGSEPIDHSVDHDAPAVVVEAQEVLSEATPAEPESPKGVEAAPSPAAQDGVDFPSPSVEELEAAQRESTAARVEALRLRVEELLGSKDRRHAMADLTRVNLAAGKEKLMNELVQVEGGSISVAVYLDNALKSLSRAS